MRGDIRMILGIALLPLAAAAGSAVQHKTARTPDPSVQVRTLAQSCEGHKFETAIRLTGPSGQLQEKKVRMCGTHGQSDADWIATLRDAVKKTAQNPSIPKAAKEQIIAAVNAEIERLNRPALLTPGGMDIAKLPKAAATTPDVPLSRDYGALPPLPTASSVAPPHVLGPGGMLGPTLRLTLRCALVGDEDRPTTCDSIDKDTVLVVRADEAFPSGVAMRFVRHGDSRAELDLPAMKPGQTANVRLPQAVCAGVVRSKLEVQALGANSPSGTPAGTIGEYDLRC